jgi:predicted dehydrogenase
MIMEQDHSMTRRNFVASTSKMVTGAVLMSQMPVTLSALGTGKKRKLAMVGTGHRGSGMWGKSVVESYGDFVEFVGLCDINPGRAETAKRMMGVSCPTFTNYEEMIAKTRPETVIVTTVDGTHHTFIAKALGMGCDVITEKPMTTDETKLKIILDAHNYRYTPTRARIKELLMQERIGRVTSVDFHWYLDVYHGADYFRRWHRLRECSGSLLNHKASHHFDLLNWWIDSDPLTVHAFGALEFYGKNHEFRHTHCRPCPMKEKCQFYWDMSKDKRLMALYAENETYDGYLRDGCVWKNDIDIFDKMTVQILYANNVQVSYSLTTYSPYEGFRIAFNGTKGRLDFWMHERQPWPMENYDELQVTDNFGKAEFIRIPYIEGDHGGADPIMKDKIFKDPSMQDPLKQAANVRDGAMAVLIGVAARKSIDSGNPVRISDLTDIVLQTRKPE